MEPVTITDLEITSHCSPSQIEGTLSNGFTFYARSRYSSFLVEFTPPGYADALYSANGTFSFDSYKWLSIEQLQKLVELYVELFDWKSEPVPAD